MENKQIDNVTQFHDCFIDKDLSLKEIFGNFIKVGIEGFRKGVQLPNVVFLVLKDLNTKEHKVVVFPIVAKNERELQINTAILKKIVKEIEEATFKAKEVQDHRLVGIIRCGVGRMKKVKIADVVKKNGDLDLGDIVRPHEDPEAKDVLIFDLEEDFVKTTMMYEYVDLGGIAVVKEDPVVENKRGYDAREDANALYGFLFTKGQSAVN